MCAATEYGRNECAQHAPMNTIAMFSRETDAPMDTASNMASHNVTLDWECEYVFDREGMTLCLATVFNALTGEVIVCFWHTFV